MTKAKKIISTTHFFIILFYMPSVAQFYCPGDLIYGYPRVMDGGSGMSTNSFSIIVYNPNLPFSVTNPSYVTIPTPMNLSTPGITVGILPAPMGLGLALMPNLNGGQPSPTLYSVIYHYNSSQMNFTYCYWNGSTWVDTGTFTPFGGGYLNNPINMGGCHEAIYTLWGGAVYANYATGSGLGSTVPLFTANAFGDIVTDCNCNFYLLYPDGLKKYDKSGNLLATFTSYGPNVAALNGPNLFSAYDYGGTAWTVVNNTLFAVGGNTLNGNNFPYGLYSAVLTGNSYSLALISTNPMFKEITDFASCPLAISQTITTTASINSGTIGCNPNILNLAVNATLSPLNYNWSGAGIGTSVQGGSVMSVSSAGIYTCTLTQESCDYVLATVVSTVTSNTTVISPQILPASAVCVNASPLFSSITNTAYSYQWHNSASGAVVNSQSIAPNTAGNYTLTVTDVSNGCYGTATASVLAQPQITLGVSSNTMCVYAYDINRVIALTPSGAIHYSIYASSGFTVPVVPSQPIVVQQTQPINAFGGGVGSATLVGSNGVCSASVSVNFSVLPVSALAITPSLVTVCKNTKQTFEAVGANVSSYTWQPQYAVTSPHGKKVNVNITAPLTVSLTGTDVFGCGTGVVTAAADVFPDLRGSLLNYADTYCAPFCAAFSFAPAAGSGAAKGAWQIENANYKANSFTHCFKQAGDYVINGILTDSIHGCSNSVSYSVQAYPRPQADFQFTPKQPIENSEDVIFTNTSSGVLLDREAVWFFPNTNLVFGETANFFYKDEGIYPVAMLVRNNYGCTDTAIKAINVLPDFFVYVPNTFTPNNDNLNDAFRAVTRGVKEFKLSVFNRWGAKVFESTDVNQGWDGTYKGEPCKVDVYVWKVTVVSAKEEKKLQGTVMLER